MSIDGDDDATAMSINCYVPKNENIREGKRVPPMVAKDDKSTIV